VSGLWNGRDHSPHGMVADGSKSSRSKVRFPPTWLLLREAMVEANMNTPDSIILSEIRDVAEIVRVACAVESVERGTSVSPHDPQVQARAADIILSGIGAQMRKVRGRQNASR
jgi:hypothetical protein